MAPYEPTTRPAQMEGWPSTSCPGCGEVVQPREWFRFGPPLELPEGRPLGVGDLRTWHADHLLDHEIASLI